MIVVFGKNFKNFIDVAIKASLVVIVFVVEACAIWFGGICGVILVVICLYCVSIGVINFVFVFDVCCMGIVVIICVNFLVIDARSFSLFSFLKVNRTFAMYFLVCFNSVVNVDGFFKCCVYCEYIDLNVKVVCDYVGGCGKDDVMYIKMLRARAVCVVEFAGGL